MTNLPHTMETYGIGGTTTVTGTITTTTAVTSDPEQGWQCPKCKRIYAPWKEACSHCPVTDYQWVYPLTYPCGTERILHLQIWSPYPLYWNGIATGTGL